MTVPDGVPSPGEMMRMLHRIDKRLDEMQKDNAERDARYERTFLRADIFEARERTDAVQLRGIEAEQHSQNKRLEELTRHVKEAREADDARRRTDRTLLWTSLVAPLIVAAIIAVFITQGG